MYLRNWKLVLAMLAIPWSGMASSQSAKINAGGGIYQESDAPDCRSDVVYLNQINGWQVRWPQQWQQLANASDEELEAAIASWAEGGSAALAADEAALGSDSGMPSAAPAPVVKRVLAQLVSLRQSIDRGPPELGPKASNEVKTKWRRLFSDELAPAVRAYEQFLQRDYRPSPNGPGIARTPHARQCFKELVKLFTSVELSPEAITRKGWTLLNANERALARLNGIPLSAVPAFLERLRSEKDPRFTAEDLTRKTEAALDRARTAMPRLFGVPLKQDLALADMPQAMEQSFPAAFYRPASAGQGAAIVLNRSRPGERKLMAEAIAFHEGLPGHHASFGLGFPPGSFNSGFIEGWGIYGEYLADEAGLYSSTADRTGMIAKHLWAASRLVVEPGLHMQGWSRARAISFMKHHTPLSEAEIEIEVDRYLVMPGQSLSYMLGYDAIASARRRAEQRLGPRFDVRQFNDAVLAKGSRPLNVMAADVDAWINSQAEH